MTDDSQAPETNPLDVSGQEGVHSDGNEPAVPEAQEENNEDQAQAEPSTDKVSEFRDMQSRIDKMQRELQEKEKDAEYWRTQYDGISSQEQATQAYREKEYEEMRQKLSAYEEEKKAAESRQVTEKLVKDDFPEFAGVELNLSGDEAYQREYLQYLKDTLVSPLKKNLGVEEETAEPASPEAGNPGSKEVSKAEFKKADLKTKAKMVERILGKTTLGDVKYRQG